MKKQSIMFVVLVGLLSLVGYLEISEAQPGGNYEWSLTMPTTRTDGTLLLLDEILRTVIECDGAEVASYDGAQSSGLITLTPGDHNCWAYVVATQYSDGSGEVSSEHSESIAFAIPVKLNPPNPPVDFGGQSTGQ